MPAGIALNSSKYYISQVSITTGVAARLPMRLGLNSCQEWWVAAIVGTMPAVYLGSHACFVDGLYAAFVLAAARIGFNAQRSDDGIPIDRPANLARPIMLQGGTS
jgi:hypothetical protein